MASKSEAAGRLGQVLLIGQGELVLRQAIRDSFSRERFIEFIVAHLRRAADSRRAESKARGGMGPRDWYCMPMRASCT